MSTGYEKGLKGESQLLADSTVKNKEKGAKANFKHLSIDWAADLPTPAKGGSFMNLFNQPRRDVITVKRDDTGSVSQALELLNGREINDAIAKSPLTQELLDSKMGVSQIVTELYLATLSRLPSSEELKIVGQNAQPTREWIEDLEWALLNSREFIFVK
jgi:spore germination protein GerM